MATEESSAEYPRLPDMAQSHTFDWTYSKRREMQEIVPGLYLGPYSAAAKSRLSSLLEHGITHIICVRAQQEAHLVRPNFPDRFTYMTLEITDSATESILRIFPSTRNFIKSALDAGGRVLVHGNTGISRSATLVVAYLMQEYGLAQREALTIVQQRRLCVCPNEGFVAQLREFEPIYRAQRTLANGEASQLRNKRPFHEVDGATDSESENVSSDL